MVNCNPETVSTDYDTSDRLYFEPLTVEDVLEILHVEAERGELLGVIVQFGGQTPLKLAAALRRRRDPDPRHLARTRSTSPRTASAFPPGRQAGPQAAGQRHGPQPRRGARGRRAHRLSGAAAAVSYVLGGRAMEMVDGPASSTIISPTAVQVSGDSPVLIDHYLRDAIEVDVDAICDGTRRRRRRVMQHIEEAGVHSGDSACSIPPHSLIRRDRRRDRAPGRELAWRWRSRG